VAFISVVAAWPWPGLVRRAGLRAARPAFVIDNRPGAGSTLGHGLGAKATPDGYTLLLGTSGGLVVSAAFGSKLAYDPVKDFTPIGVGVYVPFLIVVHPSVPAKNVKELVDLAKAQPGKINFASPGTGTPNHLGVELLTSLTGAKFTHVPYKGGGPAMADLVGGQISGSFASMPSAIGFIKSGKLRALGVSAAQRSPALPDVPTIAEAGVKGFAVLDWQGLFTTARTPPAIVRALNQEVVRILALPDVVERLTAAGVEVQTMTPDAWGGFVKSEVEKWAKVVKESGVKVE